MATTTVSIGSRSDTVDTQTPASNVSGSGPSYTVTFGTTPTGIAVGHMGFMDTEDAGGGNASDYEFVVTAIDGDNITVKYLRDSADKGHASPYGLYTGGGSSGSPVQAPMVFKRHGLPTAHNTDNDPSFVITFNDAGPPADLHVGDIAKVDDGQGGGMMMGVPVDYEYLVTAIDLSAKTVTMKYVYDSGSVGSTSPYGLSDTNGDQVLIEFHRAFSNITTFEEMVDDSSPNYWGSSDDVVGELHDDSNFTDNVIDFTNSQSLSSVKITVYSDDRHDGTADTGVVLKPTSGSGGGGILFRIAIDNFTLEWLDIDMSELDSTDSRGCVALNSGAGDVTIKNMLMHDVNHTANTSGTVGITSNLSLSTSESWYFLNNIIYNIEKSSSNASSVAIMVRAFKGNLYVYNNTIYHIKSQGGSKDAVGVRFGDGTHIQANIKNNIVAGLDEGDIAAAYWMDEVPNSNRVLNSATNLSDDTSDSAKNAEDFDVNKNDSTALIGKTLAQIDFVSDATGSPDLHLDTSSVCLEAGTDLGTTGGVNIDINGVDRDATGVTWDIGAHQRSTADTAENPAFFMFIE